MLKTESFDDCKFSLPLPVSSVDNDEEDNGPAEDIEVSLREDWYKVPRIELFSKTVSGVETIETSSTTEVEASEEAEAKRPQIELLSSTVSGIDGNPECSVTESEASQGGDELESPAIELP